LNFSAEEPDLAMNAFLLSACIIGCEAGSLFHATSQEDFSLQEASVKIGSGFSADPPPTDAECNKGLTDASKRYCCSPSCWSCGDHPECPNPKKYFTMTGQNSSMCCTDLAHVAKMQSCEKSMAPCKVPQSVQKKWKAELALPINAERHKKNRRVVKQREFRALLFEEVKKKYDFALDIARGVRKLSNLKVQEAKRRIQTAKAKLAKSLAKQGKSALTQVTKVLQDAKKKYKYKGPIRDFVYTAAIELHEDEVRFYRQIRKNARWVMGNATTGLAKVNEMKVNIQVNIEKIDEYGKEVKVMHKDSKRTYKDAKLLWKQWKNSAKTYNCAWKPSVMNAKFVCPKPNTYIRRCKVVCLKGYTSKDSRNSLRCLKQGKFGKELYGEMSGIATCIGLNCGKPPEVKKAKGIIQEVRFPNKAPYQCFEGHSVDGDAKSDKVFDIPCGDEGKYMKKAMHKCEPIRCGPALKIANSKVLNYKSIYVFTNVVEYECLEGYTTDGLAGGPKKFEINCQGSGRYTQPLQCLPVKCGPAPQYDHTKLLSDVGKHDLVYPQDLEYGCKTGYTLNQMCGGQSKYTLTCHSTGEFIVKHQNGVPLPACRAVSAGKPPQIQFADFTRREMFYPEELVVVANPGYSTKAHPNEGKQFTIKVTSDCKFSGIQEFKPVECGAAPQVAQSRHNFAKPVAVFQDLATYFCTEGYSWDKTSSRSSQNFTITCEAGGHFSAVPGEGKCVNIDDCLTHTCGPQGHCVDKLMDYSCDCKDGFEETFDEKNQEKVCGNIDDCGPEACGVGECKDGLNDYECICPSGYEQVTTGEGKTCKAVTCGTPPRVAHAMTEPVELQTTKSYYKETVKYQCLDGHTLDAHHEGPNHFDIGCLADKSFTNTKECKPIECGTPPSVLHALKEGDTAVFNESIKYECEEGYTVDETPHGDKHFYVTCLNTGDYGLPLECKPVKCGEPDQVANAQRESGIRHFGDLVKFECFEGFTIDGKPESTTEFEAECKKEGKFTGLETCNPKICGHPPSLLSALHSTIPDMGNVHYPNGAEITCLDGFTIGGNPEGNISFIVTCEDTGKFAMYNKESCEPVLCGNVPDMPNSTVKSIIDTRTDKPVDGKEMRFGYKAEYTCNPGFTAGGEHDAGKTIHVECNPNGEMSLPTEDLQCRNVNDCDRHTCGPRGTCVDLIGESPAYTCDCQDGYEMNQVKDQKFCGNIDDCGEKGCGPGICQDLVGDYTCICPSGHYLGFANGEKTCLPVLCKNEAPKLENGKMLTKHEGSVVFPVTLSYQCDLGYSTDSSPVEAKRKFQASCKNNGDFKGMMSCQPVTCGSPHVFAHTSLVAPENKRQVLTFGQQAMYKCDEGYSVLGKAGGQVAFNIKCMETGILTKPEVCEAVKCGKAPVMPKARASLAGDVVFGQDVQYECDKGYTLDQTPMGLHHFHRACTKNGQFEETDAECKPIKHGEAPDVENAYIAMIEGEEVKDGESTPILYYPQGVEYKCRPGHTLNGGPSGQIKFVTNVNDAGQLDPPLPARCKPITYTIKGMIKNARTGAGLEGARVQVMSSGQSILSNVGFFTVEGIKAGELELKYSMDDFISTTKKLNIVGDVNSGGLADMVMSPDMSSDQWRAVVKWGEYPADLDSYLKWGTTEVAWYNDYASTHIAGRLEVDDTDSWGPETIHISRVGDCDGGSFMCDVKYMINDYDETEELFEKSDAEVTLFNGDMVAGSWKIRECPEAISEDKYWWHVFTIDSKTNKLKWHCGMKEMLLHLPDETKLTDKMRRDNFDNYLGPFPGRYLGKHGRGAHAGTNSTLPGKLRGKQLIP
jgi:hypothetical protein